MRKWCVILGRSLCWWASWFLQPRWLLVIYTNGTTMTDSSLLGKKLILNRKSHKLSDWSYRCDYVKDTIRIFLSLLSHTICHVNNGPGYEISRCEVYWMVNDKHWIKIIKPQKIWYYGICDMGTMICGRIKKTTARK